MEPRRTLAPCLIGRGTLSSYRDMLRALETIESVEYTYSVDGEITDQGRAALVKLMADPDSSTLIVNGCLFLNVASFRYLDFEPIADDAWGFTLYGDGATLKMVSVPDESDSEGGPSRPSLLTYDEAPDFESLILLDDDDEDD